MMVLTLDGTMTTIVVEDAVVVKVAIKMRKFSIPKMLAFSTSWVNDVKWSQQYVPSHVLENDHSWPWKRVSAIGYFQSPFARFPFSAQRGEKSAMVPSWVRHMFYYCNRKRTSPQFSNSCNFERPHVLEALKDQWRGTEPVCWRPRRLRVFQRDGSGNCRGTCSLNDSSVTL